MNGQDPSERDWNLFRELRQAALDRFCSRVLQEIGPVTEDDSRTSHERYLGVFQLLKERDRQLSVAFDNPQRSHMIEQLAAIHAYGLIETEELAGFSAATREAVAALGRPPEP